MSEGRRERREKEGRKERKKEGGERKKEGRGRRGRKALSICLTFLQNCVLARRLWVPFLTFPFSSLLFF